MPTTMDLPRLVALVEDAVRHDAPLPRNTWSAALCFELVDRAVGVQAPASPSHRTIIGDFVQRVAQTIFKSGRTRWRERLESGLVAVREAGGGSKKWSGSWTRFAVDYFASKGIDFVDCVWNWQAGGGVVPEWFTNSDVGRKRFLKALASALDQTGTDVETVNTAILKQLGLQKAFEASWGAGRLQEMLDAGFSERRRLADAPKGSFVSLESTVDFLRSVAGRLYPDWRLDSLTLAQAVTLEQRVRDEFPGAGKGRAWSALRSLNPALPLEKPRASSPRLPNLTFETAVAFVRSTVEHKFGANWSASRDGRLEVRVAILGFSPDGSGRRSLHRGLKDLGLGRLLAGRGRAGTSFRSDAVKIAAQALPEAVHQLDLVPLSAAEWTRLRTLGECATYIRWVYSVLLGVPRPSDAPEVTGGRLDEFGVVFRSAYRATTSDETRAGGLRTALVDAFGVEEVERCRWVHVERGTSKEPTRSIEALRETVCAELEGGPSRKTLRTWLLARAQHDGLKAWLQRKKFVTLLRAYASDDGEHAQVALFVHAFAAEGLQPWDLPRFGFRSAPPAQLAEIVRDHWEQTGCSPSSDLQACADALSYACLAEAGLGGIFHVRPSAKGRSLAEHLARCAAPGASWSSVRFTEQDELFALGLEFERVVLQTFERAGLGACVDYQYRTTIDERTIIPDFRLRDEALAQRLGGAIFVDAKLSSAALTATSNVIPMQKAGTVLVVCMVGTNGNTAEGINVLTWEAFADALHFVGPARDALAEQVSDLKRRRGAALRT